MMNFLQAKPQIESERQKITRFVLYDQVDTR